MVDVEMHSTALISSPAGCAFLWLLETSGLTAEMAGRPAVSLHAAGRALGDIRVWWPDHARRVAAALAQGASLGALARTILAQPEAAWWFGPLDRRAQLWVARADEAAAPPRPVSPTTPPTGWERYAQKPAWGLYTSTEIAGTCSLLAGAAEHAGDLDAALEPPLVCYRLRASPKARVYEIDGPAAWRRLCLTYRAPGEASLTNGLVVPDSAVVPDFAAVARDWDAVHLSLGGLLTAEQVRLDGPEGPTQLQGWDAEQTVWLRWMFDDVEHLPDVHSLPVAPVPLAHGLPLELHQSPASLRQTLRRVSEGGKEP